MDGPSGECFLIGVGRVCTVIGVDVKSRSLGIDCERGVAVGFKWIQLT